MSNITVLTEESLGLVAGGKNRFCDRPPSTNHAELYPWSTHCARLNGGSPREWYMNGYDMLTAQPQEPPKKQPKK